MRRTRVKVCGVTRVEDALWAAELGVDAVGLNFVASSPRRIDKNHARRIASALPAFVGAVGVFAAAEIEEVRRLSLAVGLSAAQLHGEEPAEWIAALAPLPTIKAFRWQGRETRSRIEGFLDRCAAASAGPSAILVDAFHPKLAGGSGATWSWDEWGDGRPSAPMILAGGLNPSNVGDAIRALRPFAVDVASGVENAPGVKDRALLKTFVEAVAAADRAIAAERSTATS